MSKCQGGHWQGFVQNHKDPIPTQGNVCYVKAHGMVLLWLAFCEEVGWRGSAMEHFCQGAYIVWPSLSWLTLPEKLGQRLGVQLTQSAWRGMHLVYAHLLPVMLQFWECQNAPVQQLLRQCHVGSGSMPPLVRRAVSGDRMLGKWLGISISAWNLQFAL